MKNPAEPPDKYVEALAGGDIQTNPAATNAAVQRLNKDYVRQVDRLPPESVLKEINQKVDTVEMERVLMAEGTKKFAEAQTTLLRVIAQKRASIGSLSHPRVTT